MKKLIVGSVGVLSSVILFGLTRVSAAIYALYLTQPSGAGWNTNLGPFGTALRSIGTFPTIISALLFLVGICFIVIGLKKET